MLSCQVQAKKNKKPNELNTLPSQQRNKYRDGRRFVLEHVFKVESSTSKRCWNNPDNFYRIMFIFLVFMLYNTKALEHSLKRQNTE